MFKEQKKLGKVLCLFFLSIFASNIYSKDQVLFLHCLVTGDGITLEESFVVDGKAPKNTSNLNGDFLVELKNASGGLIYKRSLRSPLQTPVDGLENSVELSGGIKKMDSGILVVRVPLTKTTDEISIRKISDANRSLGEKLLSTTIEKALNMQKRSEVERVESTMELVGGDGSDNRVDFVILSEGYTQSELSSGKFMRDLQVGYDHMFARTPYKEYKDYFNTYAISVASQSSGSGGYFQSIVSGRLIYLGGTGTSRVSALLQKHMPTYDMVLVLINTTEYGGAGAQFATASVNAQSGELILHETGHGYALLADEYDYPGASTFESVNATAETDRARIKWNVWIESSTPIPTPETSSYASDVGLFEGAMYKASGFYRPKLNCKMKSLGQPFCEVCRESIIARAYEECSPIDSYSPSGTNLDYISIPNKTLSVDLLNPTLNSVDVYWSLNGEDLTNSGANLDLSTLDLIQGDNEISAYVIDNTDWVRIDYNKPQLEDEVNWIVNYDQTSSKLTSSSHISQPFSVNGSSVKLNISNPSNVKISVVNAKGVTVKEVIRHFASVGNFTIPLHKESLAKGVYLLKVDINKQGVFRQNLLNL